LYLQEILVVLLDFNWRMRCRLWYGETILTYEWMGGFNWSIQKWIFSSTMDCHCTTTILYCFYIRFTYDN